VVRIWSVLDFGTIGGLLPSMQGMYGSLGVWVVEMHKSMFNIPQHRGAPVIVPLQGEATVPGGFPIIGDLVMAMEHSQETGGIITIGKIIDIQGEADVMGVSCQQPGLKGHGW